MTEPRQFGWVDEDGTVHVRLPDGGDAVVGQYAAGDSDAALAFFGRKFEDVVAEVRLTAERLQQGKSSTDQVNAVIERVRSSLTAPNFVGDIAGLNQLLDALHAAAAEKQLTNQAEQARQRTEVSATRAELVGEAERLASSTQWKATGERFKELLEQWKALPRFDRKAEQALWERFSHARTQFDKARKAHFSALQETRGQAMDVKRALIAEAEALASSTDWAETSRAYRTLMDRWKAAPRAARQDEDKLWIRFRAAQDKFFDARNAQNASRDAEQVQNQAAKEALLERAEAILPVTDVAAAKQQLRTIADEWEAIGHVPRDQKPKLEARLRKVEEAIAAADRKQWQRSDPAMRDRAEQTAASFRASVSKLEAELAAAEDRGDQRKVRSLQSTLANARALLEAADRAVAEYS